MKPELKRTIDTVLVFFIVIINVNLMGLSWNGTHHKLAIVLAEISLALIVGRILL